MSNDLVSLLIEDGLHVLIVENDLFPQSIACFSSEDAQLSKSSGTLDWIDRVGEHVC